MGKIRLIIAREYLTRVKKKSFILMTVLGPILMVGFLVLAIFVSLHDSSVHKVLVIDDTQEIGGLANGLKYGSDEFLIKQSGKQLSKKEFNDSDYDYEVYINRNVLENKSVMLTYKKEPKEGFVTSIILQLNQNFEKAMVAKNGKINIKDYQDIKAGISLKRISSNEDTDGRSAKAAVGFFFAIFIYLFIFLYGAQIMRGVIEEKTNRVVEIIVSSVSPFQLMMGKIIGIGLVGLTQFVIWVVLMIVLMGTAQSALFADMNDPNTIADMQTVAENVHTPLKEIGNTSEIYELIFHKINYAAIISLFIFYFIGGYLLYGALFAAIGAAVDSESDTQQFMLPITIPLIFSFIVAEMGVANPDGGALTWAAVVPFTSPISVMVKVAMGYEAGSVWQLYVSMILLILAFLFTTWLAGKIYRTGILMYGKKPTYKEIWKWIKYS